MYCGYYVTAFIGCCLGLFVILTTNLTVVWKDQSVLSSLKSQSIDGPKELASAVWCTNRLDGSKKCSFKNLYYSPQYKECLFFFLNEYSVVSGIESLSTLNRISLSTIRNHGGLFLKIIVIHDSSEFLKQNDTVFLDNVLIMKRFKPDNIMHVIHDDLLPLFITLQELCYGDVPLCVSTYKLIFMDDNDKGPYYEWYTYFSNHTPILLSNQNTTICFKRSVIGLSHESVWFQYGFKTPHGPLVNKNFSGHIVRQFSEFIKQQMGIVEENGQFSARESIVFLSRKINRKVIEDEIVQARIKEIYENVYKRPVEIQNMDLSINGSKSLISSLQKSSILIGMHGSAMILSLFLPPGSIIIELFPFGIQPEYVSFLQALCSLQNLFYNYHPWVNQDESNSRTHPEYSPLLGGIFHLDHAQQETIMNVKLVPAVECCHNPVYLFRMFQDTVVDDGFYDLIFNIFSTRTETVNKSEFNKRLQIYLYDLWYSPSPVFNLSCECNRKKLKVKWDHPTPSLSKVKFSVATSVGLSAVTEFTHLIAEIEECDDDRGVNVNTVTVSVWVNTLEGDKESIDTYTLCTS